MRTQQAAEDHGAAAQVRYEVPPQAPQLREILVRHRVRQIHHPSEIIGGVGAEFPACDFAIRHGAYVLSLRSIDVGSWPSDIHRLEIQGSPLSRHPELGYERVLVPEPPEK